MRSDDPPALGLPNTSRPDVDHLRRRAKPNFPSRFRGASTPVDAFPIEEKPLILQPYVIESRSPHRVARFRAVSDLHFFVVPPPVPPHGRGQSHFSCTSEAVTTQQGLPKRRQITGSRLDPAIRAEQLGKDERGPWAALEEVDQRAYRPGEVQDIRVADDNYVAMRSGDTLIVRCRESYVVFVLNKPNVGKLRPHRGRTSVYRRIVNNYYLELVIRHLTS